MRMLILSTPVAPLGSGIGGGVELTIHNLAYILQQRRHHVEILAPKGSWLPVSSVIQIQGELQPRAQHQNRNEKTDTPSNSVLTNMCTYAKKHQHRYDLILSFAYDWLPLYLTSQFETPLAHFMSMSSLNDALDYELKRVAAEFPRRLGCYSKAQANTFPVPEAFTILKSGIDLSKYSYCGQPGNYHVWAGRISPEKGLEDALQATQLLKSPLKILGKLEDKEYWESMCREYPEAAVDYIGFLETGEMQKVLRKAKALLMTPHWTEAFGMVVIEAFACGVPVVSYNRGGPAEIIEPGKTGFLVEAGRTEQLAAAVGRIEQIRRSDCRRTAEKLYSLEIWGDRFEEWMQSLVKVYRV
ncbi:MAG: glycosyltransferase family 4 protein [Balneolaceae bacterium]